MGTVANDTGRCGRKEQGEQSSVHDTTRDRTPRGADAEQKPSQASERKRQRQSGDPGEWEGKQARRRDTEGGEKHGTRWREHAEAANDG